MTTFCSSMGRIATTKCTPRKMTGAESLGLQEPLCPTNVFAQLWDHAQQLACLACVCAGLASFLLPSRPRETDTQKAPPPPITEEARRFHASLPSCYLPAPRACPVLLVVSVRKRSVGLCSVAFILTKESRHTSANLVGSRQSTKKMPVPRANEIMPKSKISCRAKGTPAYG